MFAKGGYVCLPLGLAARLLRIPLSIHDSDTRPGLTNRLLARFAQSIATGYPLNNYRYPLSRSSYVGVPIKQEFRPVPALKQRELKQKLGFDPTRPLVVAVGGGLGAVSINTAMIQAAPRLIEAGVAALIVAGKANYDTAHSEAGPYEPHYRVVDFVPGLYEVLAAADIVVTRASATSLQELAGLKKPIIVVPARGLGDQHKNAQVYQEANAAVVLSDDELATGKLTPTLVELLSDTNRSDLVASRLHEFARPDAAKAMAKIIIKTAQA